MRLTSPTQHVSDFFVVMDMLLVEHLNFVIITWKFVLADFQHLLLQQDKAKQCMLGGLQLVKDPCAPWVKLPPALAVGGKSFHACSRLQCSIIIKPKNYIPSNLAMAG
jgi:hypothetical protein